MSSHHLEHEGLLVTSGSGDYGVDSLYDPVEGWVDTDGHICAAEVIVYRAKYPHDVQVRVNHSLFIRDHTYTENDNIHLACANLFQVPNVHSQSLRVIFLF